MYFKILEQVSKTRGVAIDDVYRSKNSSNVKLTSLAAQETSVCAVLCAKNYWVWSICAIGNRVRDFARNHKDGTTFTIQARGRM